MDNALNAQMDLARLQANQPRDTASRVKGMDKTQIRETAENFEAMVMNQFLSHMFTDLDPNTPMGGGKGEEIFQSLMVDEYAKGIVRNGGVGIADMVEQQLLQYQEQRSFE